MELTEISRKIDTIVKIVDTVKYFNDYRERFKYTVEVNSNDSTLYRATHKWLTQNLPFSSTRHLVFESTHDPMAVFSDQPSGSTLGLVKKVVRLNHVVNVDGHKVRVRDHSQEHTEEQIGSISRNVVRASRVDQKVVFVCKSQQAQQAVESMLSRILRETERKTPTLYTANSWNNWDDKELRGRGLQSVVLPEGLGEELKDDLREFLESEDKYLNLGIPYKRGYIFSGLPGTGKSSLVKALASEFGLDLWYAPLGDMKEDSTFTEMISSIKESGILLLEDVDTYSNAIGRDASSAGKTGMGTLLNVLDGVLSPHGLIVMMTTNHIENLDPAFTRPGRADKTVHFSYPSLDEVKRFYSLYFPDETIDLSGFSDSVLTVSQAQISEALKSNWKDPVAAEMALKTLLVESETIPVSIIEGR